MNKLQLTVAEEHIKKNHRGTIGKIQTVGNLRTASFFNNNNNNQKKQVARKDRDDKKTCKFFYKMQICIWSYFKR